MSTPDNLKLNKEMIGPKNGWETDTYYYVDVAFNSVNPIHKAILHVWLLNDNKEPENFHAHIWNPIYDSRYKLHDVYYLKVISKIGVN